MKYLKILLLCMLTLSSVSCRQSNALVPDWQAYTNNHELWQLSRLERLRAERGWLNLAGLLWLEEGENTFGSDPSNSIVFPEKFPPFGGSIFLFDSTASLRVAEGIDIQVNDSSVLEIQLRHDQQEGTTTLAYENFRWFIIRRGDKYAIRLRDLEHPRIKQLDHIPAYAPNKKWIIEADFIPFDSVKTIAVPTVIPDFFEYYKAPGELRFKLSNKEYSLLPFSSGAGYFLIVGDASNGIETYGAGRFLYTENINGNKVIIDFNRATNPPCAFSPFATCPLPPVENILDIKIEAGEKAVHLD